jgi:prevent-host-death family protein
MIVADVLPLHLARQVSALECQDQHKVAKLASSRILMRTLTSVEAQNRFGELLDAAQREPITITRRGRTVAFMVSPEDLRELLDARQSRVAALAAYEAYQARVAARLSDAGKALTDDDVARLVDEVLDEVDGQ